MKRFFYILCAGLAVLAAASCQEELSSQYDNPAPKGELTTVTVSASLENDADETKTALDLGDGSVSWGEHDAIKVVWNGGNAISEGDPVIDAGNASFTISVGDGDKYAVYPSTVDASYDGSAFSVSVPASQDGTFANAAIMVAPWGENLAFKNLGGLLQIKINNENVDKIRISSNSSTPLAGTAAVTFSAGLPVIGAISGPQTSIELSIAKTAGEQTYYAAVLPASLEAGIYVELLDGVSVIGEKLTGNTLTVARREVRKLGTIAATTISNKKFFKVDGSGDGSSWDSPLGAEDLSTVLKGGSDATLFLAQGTYEPAAEISLTAHTYKIYGGYPADATGTSLSGRNISAETAISGGDDTVDADGNHRILVLATTGINLVADGITFKNAYKNSDDVGSALILNTLASASFNNCTIKNNVKAGGGNGGAVRIATGNNVTFTNCLFENNTCASNGGAVNISGSGTHTFDNCSFINNKATASSKRGGAIFGASGAYVLHLNKCYFGTEKAGAAGDDKNSGNEAKNGGGAIWGDSSTGKIFLNACSFYGNKTATYASVLGSRGICGINNCAIQNNSNSSGESYPCSIQPINGHFIVANTSIRLAANAGAALHPYGGTAYLVNNTMVNSLSSDDPDKAVALRSDKAVISYGHNIISKFEEKAEPASYSVDDAVNHNDALNYMLSQNWQTSSHVIYWVKWNNGTEDVRPVGFVMGNLARVEAAIDAFDTAAGLSGTATFKSWLQSLNIDGHDALHTDLLGYVRQDPTGKTPSTTWPGCYERPKSYKIE